MNHPRKFSARLLLALLALGVLSACAHDPEPFANERSLAEEERDREHQMAMIDQQQRDMEASRRQQAAADAQEAERVENSDNQSEDSAVDTRKARQDRQLGALNRTGVVGTNLPQMSVPSVSMPGVLR